MYSITPTVATQPLYAIDSMSNDQSWEQIQTGPFPNTLYFLDTAVYNQTSKSHPNTFGSIPEKLLSELYSAVKLQKIAEYYFATVHSWLPLVWKRRIHQSISDRDKRPDPGLLTLFAAMKMVSEGPNATSHPRNYWLYRAVKDYVFALEGSGYLHLNLLQASILITIFEIGHGIYPAAYFSTGYCARLGHVMGLHGGSSISMPYRKPASWGETEEMRRTWCAVLALDRYITPGPDNYS